MKLKALIVVLAGALVLGACSQKTEGSTKKGSAKSIPVVAEPVKLDLQLPIYGSDKVWKSQDYEGKPILIAIMATWCPWCKRSLAALDKTAEAYAGKVEVVGVFDGTDLDEIGKIKEEYQIKTKILYDGRTAMNKLDAGGFPYIILFDKKHGWVRAWEGYSSDLAEKYAQEIDKLLK